MDIRSYLEHRKIKGKDFAKEIEISHPYLSQILEGKRSPSKYLALMIEAKTNGAVKAKELRPDIKKISCS